MLWQHILLFIERREYYMLKKIAQENYLNCTFVCIKSGPNKHKCILRLCYFTYKASANVQHGVHLIA